MSSAETMIPEIPEAAAHAGEGAAHAAEEVAEGATKAAEEGANKAGWISKTAQKLFMNGEPKLAEIASKKNVAVSELKFFDRMSKLKTGGILAGGVVLAAVLAGIGNKGPGKYAEDVSRGNEQQTGAAVA